MGIYDSNKTAKMIAVGEGECDLIILGSFSLALLICFGNFLFYLLYY